MIALNKNVWMFVAALTLFASNYVSALAANDHPFDYTTYTGLLEGHIDSNGMVDYKSLKSNSAKLDDFVNSLAVVEKKAYKIWTRDQQLAFWINAYNAFTLKAIVDNHPIKSSWLKSLNFPKNSIRQIPGVWDKIKFNVMDKQITLTHIEHEILRKEFDEPRIHFAIVCASIGCPVLRKEPYLAKKLNEQLKDQTQIFLIDKNKFHIDHENARVSISPIFKWFSQDFVKLYPEQKTYRGHNNPQAAIIRFIIENLSEIETYNWQGSSRAYRIFYLDYDRFSNEQRNE